MTSKVSPTPTARRWFDLSDVIPVFAIYAVLGWIFETIVVAVMDDGHLEAKRGFLFGPYLPIYGFGMLAILSIVKRTDKKIVVMLKTMLVAGFLELSTGYLLETFFHKRYWDYSSYHFNIDGYTCLADLLLFGVLAIVVCAFVQPKVDRLLETDLSPKTLRILSVVIFAIFVIDTVASVIHTLLT